MYFCIVLSPACWLQAGVSEQQQCCLLAGSEADTAQPLIHNVTSMLVHAVALYASLSQVCTGVPHGAGECCSVADAETLQSADTLLIPFTSYLFCCRAVCYPVTSYLLGCRTVYLQASAGVPGAARKRGSKADAEFCSSLTLYCFFWRAV
jgi:hypothetical protein